jgi:transcriptional regulator with XRE-family HTH domain
LGEALQSWRAGVRPEDVGLPRRGPRRVPGLRREELAQLAGVSADYIARLEQGRADAPSAQVLGALARALRLDDGKRAHLYALAARALPSPGLVPQHTTPNVARLVDQLVSR